SDVPSNILMSRVAPSQLAPIVTLALEPVPLSARLTYWFVSNASAILLVVLSRRPAFFDAPDETRRVLLPKIDGSAPQGRTLGVFLPYAEGGKAKRRVANRFEAVALDHREIAATVDAPYLN